MLGFYVDFIDDIVDSIKRNPGWSAAAAIAGGIYTGQPSLRRGRLRYR